MKRIRSKESLSQKYAEGIDRNVEKYRENAEESADIYAEHFTPFYLEQIIASLSTRRLKGRTRQIMYSVALAKLDAKTREALERMIIQEAKNEGLNISEVKVTPEKIEKAIKAIAL